MRTFFILFFLSCVTILYSDKVFFSNSDQLTGEIWKATPYNLILICEHGKYKINSRNIQRIEFDNEYKYRLILNDGKSFLVNPIESDSENLKYNEIVEKSNLSSMTKTIEWKHILVLRLIKK